MRPTPPGYWHTAEPRVNFYLDPLIDIDKMLNSSSQLKYQSIDVWQGRHNLQYWEQMVQVYVHIATYSQRLYHFYKIFTTEK